MSVSELQRLFMNKDRMTFDEIMQHLRIENPDSNIVHWDVCQKNTGKYRTCIYVDGSLAGKENTDGTYKLCNQFA